MTQITVKDIYGKKVFYFQELGRIRYSGLVHLGDMFQHIRNWHQKRKYFFNEKIIKHKFGVTGLEKESEWRSKKRVYDYLEYEIRMRFKIKDILDVEVIRDGKKEKLQQCRLLIEIDGHLTIDPFERFKGPFAQNLKSIYHRFFAKKTLILKWEDTFEKELKSLKDDITKYLEFEQHA